jgi:Ribonuclease 2-5A
LFWNESKIESFFSAVNDKIQKYVWKNQKFIENLNSNGYEIFGDNWRTKIDKSILLDLESFVRIGKTKPYDEKSVVDLIRAMRNAVSSNLIKSTEFFNCANISGTTSQATIFLWFFTTLAFKIPTTFFLHLPCFTVHFKRNR